MSTYVDFWPNNYPILYPSLGNPTTHIAIKFPGLLFIRQKIVMHQKLQNSWVIQLSVLNTGKSLSEALIFASTKPKCDNKLFIELEAQTWGEHVVCRNCSWHSEQFLYTICFPHVLTKIYLHILYNFYKFHDNSRYVFIVYKCTKEVVVFRLTWLETIRYCI